MCLLSENIRPTAMKIIVDGEEWTIVQPVTIINGLTLFKSTRLEYIPNLGRFATIRKNRLFLLGPSDKYCDQCTAHGLQ